jgi:hypothetical protein
VRRRTASILALVLTAGAALGQSSAPAAQPGYSGDRVVRVAPASGAELERVLGLARHLWSERVGRGPIEVQVTPEAYQTLLDEGFAPEVLIEDVGALAEAERRAIEARRAELALNRGGDAIDFTNYYPYADILAFMAQLAAERPDMVSIQPVGQTIQGRDIMTMTITAPGDASDRPQIAINSLIHAREWITPPATLMLASRLVREYGPDPRITSLLDQTRFVITPVLNADGYVYAWTTERFWRKNRRNNGNGTFGVDLNRNFATNFAGNGSSPQTSSETYRGPSAFSEPESAAMRDMLSALPDLRAHVDTHSFSQLVLWSPGVIGQVVPNEAQLADLGTDLAQTILDTSGAVYSPQRGIDLYEAGGTFSDWTTDALGLLGYTFELRPATSAEGGFAPSPDLILPTANEITAAYLHLAEAAATPIRFIIPDISSLTFDQPVTYTFAVLPATDTPSGPVSVFTRLGGAGAFTQTIATPLGDDRYSVQLDPADCGSTLQLYISVNTSAGTPATFPFASAGAPIVIPIANEQTVFADSFATNLGWTVTNAPALTDGGWERGVPAGGGDRNDPPADADGDGFAYLTDNVDGNSDVDGGPTTLISPTLDASAGDATLGYAVWFSDSLAQDSMSIDLSGDNGATWVPADQVFTAGAWQQRAIDVAALLGRPAQLRMRLSVTDANTASVVEAGLDAVRLTVDIPCPAPSCPADTNGDGLLSPADFSAWIAAFNAQAPACDQNADGACTPADFSAWIANFNAGCP